MSNNTAQPNPLTLLKAGDKVIYDDGSRSEWGSGPSDSIQTVDRVTATQVIIKVSRGSDVAPLEMRFNKEHGYRTGEDRRNSWTRASRIRVGTEEEMAKVRDARLQYKLASRLSSVKWAKLSLSTLKHVSQALEDSAPPTAQE